VAKSRGTVGAHSGPRKAAAVAVLVVVALLFFGVTRQSWTSSTTREQVVKLEAAGADMMHGMTTLLAALVKAQSAAVRGEPVDQDEVRAAFSSLSDPDQRYGSQLQTTRRLAELRTQVENAFTAQDSGPAAYATYSALVDITFELIHVIGDTSHLIHDPDLDSYYLMDAATVRLPRAMIYAGRAVDMVVLSGGELSGGFEARVAVARFSVAQEADAVRTGLLASVDFTARAELGTNIAELLDAFQTAADEFAPPTMLQALANDLDAATTTATATRVFDTAGSLSHRLLGELQALLDVRVEAIAAERRFTVIASVAAGLLALAMVWLVLGRSRTKRAVAGEPTTAGRGLATVSTPERKEPDWSEWSARAASEGDLTGAATRRSGNAR
jgi:hypothetical protein